MNNTASLDDGRKFELQKSLADALIEIGHLDEAGLLLKQCEKHAVQNNITNIAGPVHESIAEFYLKQRKHNLAGDYYIKAADECVASSDCSTVIYVTLASNAACAYFASGNENALEKAQSIARALHDQLAELPTELRRDIAANLDSILQFTSTR